MITNTTTVIGCNLKVIMALDRQYKFTTDKMQNLIMHLPIKLDDVNKMIEIRIQECIFMPDEVFIRFDSMEDFEKWKVKKKALARFCKDGVLRKENVFDR